MSLSEEISFDNRGEVVRFPLFRKLFLTLIIILVAILAFGIGQLSVVGKKEGVRIEYDPEISSSQFPTRLPDGQVSNQALISNENSLKIENSDQVVVSKNGSKYHYLHCSSAEQIKEENKITFATAQEAESAGYTLASNCKPK